MALPIFQAELLTILVFMFIQDPVLGLAAIALYPLQGYLIPKLQRKVNSLGKERVRAVLLSVRSARAQRRRRGPCQQRPLHARLVPQRLGKIYDIASRSINVSFSSNS